MLASGSGACGTAVRAARAAAAAAHAAQRSAHALAAGAVFTMDRTFDAAAVGTFTALTGDTNPIHAAAQPGGLEQQHEPPHQPPQPVVPGLLLASLFPAIIGSNFPGALYLTQSLAFRSRCAVGEPVTAEVTVTAASGGRVRFATACRSAADGRTLVDGAALALMRGGGGGGGDCDST
ncbi:MAG: hypothetical protein J3K34DRAFT_523103 [Monoraphidium minutum]|nr:MAG: hypothetical protein J3K34DRAFT_523103 [Monoraphidium minutum]